MAGIDHILRRVILFRYYTIFQPHEPQNFLPGASGFPQDGHTGAAGAFTTFSAGAPITHAAPQEPQNFAPGFIGFPHFEQAGPDDKGGGARASDGVTVGTKDSGAGSCFETTLDTCFTTSSWTFCWTCCCTCCSALATADSTIFWPVVGSISPTTTFHSAGGRITTCDISPAV